MEGKRGDERGQWIKVFNGSKTNERITEQEMRRQTPKLEGGTITILPPEDRLSSTDIQDNQDQPTGNVLN